MTAVLATSLAAAEVGRLWRVGVTGQTCAPAQPAPTSRVAPAPWPGNHLQDRLKDGRTQIGSSWCSDCDVTWKGGGACFICDTNPTTNP